MKFRYASNVSKYQNYSEEFTIAQNIFNERAEKMKKARKIKEIQYQTDGFTIILESKDELMNPTKALAVFSQELAKMETLIEFKDSQNHLLCGNGIVTELERDKKSFDDSTSEILKTVVDIFMSSKVSDNQFVSLGRREAQKKIIQICKDFKALE